MKWNKVKQISLGVYVCEGKANKRCIKPKGERKPLLTNTVLKFVIYGEKSKLASPIKYQNQFLMD